MTAPRRAAAVVLVAVLALLVGCHPRGEQPAPSSADPAAPPVIVVGTRPNPTWISDPADSPFMFEPVVRVLDRTLLVGSLSAGRITALKAADGSVQWGLEKGDNRIGDAEIGTLPLVTSAATGLVFVAFRQVCVSPCEGVPAGTKTISGVAALEAHTGLLRWRTVLTTVDVDTPPFAVQVASFVVDADADGVLVRLGGEFHVPTPGGDPSTSTVLLDAATGTEQWRVEAVAPTGFSDGVVLGRRTGDVEDDRAFDTVLDRGDGSRLDAPVSGSTLGADGPAVLVEADTLVLLGPDGQPVPVDGLSGATATCVPADGLVCVLSGQDRRLLTWFPDEPAPTVAPLWDGELTAAGAVGEIVLVGDDPAGDEVGASWIAVGRDGTPLSVRRPGEVLAVGEHYVVVRASTEPAIGYAAQVWSLDLP